jgi:hypothetical protein
MTRDFLCKIKLVIIPCKINQYRPKLLNGSFLLYYGLALLILKLVIIPFLFYFPETGFFADVTKTGLFELANSARKQLGLKSLNENPVLNTAAYLKAKHMMENGYFAHYSPEGITPWYWLETSGYGYKAAGENLAIGFIESEQVHSAWMDSGSHKKNILNPNFQEMGIAVLRDNFQGRETTLVVQFFGTQKIVIPEAPKPETVQPPIATTEETEIAEEEETGTTEEVVEVAGEEGEEAETPVISEEEEPEELIVSEEEKEEALALAITDKTSKTPTFALFQFMMSDYYDLIQGIIYGSLVLIIITLFVTVFCDVFIYRRFTIDYRDAVLKAVSFSVLWLVLLFLDKMVMIEFINPQNFMI